MSETNYDIAQLIVKHLNEELTAQEQAALTNWLEVSPENRVLFDRYTQEYIQGKLDYYTAIDEKAGWDKISIALPAIAQATDADYRPIAHRVHFLRTAWFRYAAAILLLVSGIAIWYAIQPAPMTAPQAILPGSNKAILTVGNKTIDLSSNKTGIAVGNVITYNDGEKITDAGRQMLLTTPRGGQYQASLPDGSKIWLNAASSVTFPSKFTGDSREVEITGEVYIEVVKNSKQPFRVKANGTEIQVLGTSFNINAYPDEEAVRTTLVEGSVKVIANNVSGKAILKPGQQADIDSKGISVHPAETEQALAWKNGVFNFQDKSLQEVMRQLARWYDIDVKYLGEPSARKFKGKLPRDLNLSQVIEILQEMEVKFHVEGRTLIVTP